MSLSDTTSLAHSILQGSMQLSQRQCSMPLNKLQGSSADASLPRQQHAKHAAALLQHMYLPLCPHALPPSHTPRSQQVTGHPIGMSVWQAQWCIQCAAQLLDVPR